MTAVRVGRARSAAPLSHDGIDQSQESLVSHFGSLFVVSWLLLTFWSTAICAHQLVPISVQQIVNAVSMRELRE
jgi:hypothetical protein